MLTNTTFLVGLAVHATDGEAGKVTDLYFDDDTWSVRYLIVETGGWLNGRSVLISPMAVIQADWPFQQLDLALTKKQIENSPLIDTRQPVTRQHEADFLGYYGYPYYWTGPNLWGPAYYPGDIANLAPYTRQSVPEVVGKVHGDSRLQSAATVTGFHVEALDGEIGHIDGYVVDDGTWTIRYLSVATTNWFPGKKVLVSPGWAENVSWRESKVYLSLTKETIKSAPEYLESRPLTREYENSLFIHYGRAPYWVAQAANAV